MAPPNIAFYLRCILLGSIAHMMALKPSSSVRQDHGFVSANVGDTVTLNCSCEDDVADMFYWYKQAVGQKLQLMSTFYKYDTNGTFHDEFKNDRRFNLETENGGNHLKISDLQLSDSATYFCVSSDSYAVEFGEGVTLSVRGSGLNIQASVQPVSETKPGDSVTLNCIVHTGTCGGEYSVYWYRSSEDSQPRAIYTHGVINDQCEKKPTTQTQTCVHHFPMKNLSLSDNGTYYCAVVSCGEILFGNGTKLVIEHGVDSPVLVYFLSAALGFTIILVLVLAFSLYKMNKRNCSHCTDSPTRHSAASSPNVEGEDADNLHYAALSEHKANRSRRQRDNTNTTCVYSSIRQ